METNINNMSLKEVLNFMRRVREDGYNCYIKGRGNGNIGLIIEDNKITIS